MTLVLEGTTEDLLKEMFAQGFSLTTRAKFIIEDIKISTAEKNIDEKIRLLNEFVKSQQHITHFVDDSREAIYEGDWRG